MSNYRDGICADSGHPTACGCDDPDSRVVSASTVALAKLILLRMIRGRKPGYDGLEVYRLHTDGPTSATEWMRRTTEAIDYLVWAKLVTVNGGRYSVASEMTS